MLERERERKEETKGEETQKNLSVSQSVLALSPSGTHDQLWL